ncbi:malonate decarboxylase holo-[acyl-carrier-protein] synthase [Herbaspirillum sp. RV1423]|uniref:malonate decarboxylase holo-[acyl-carrier-protein] synthase n=1 Tax=Herbaspirillum sp. RV1423 TaxID=1443993 RepID=UPI0004B89B9E|nr:malonate decarboxylase holo-[acyl-carrier-protein] synthase [Herbaspirillum sp. RV1423]
MSSLYKRHGLVWLNADGWREALGRAAEPHCVAVRRWQQNDWPAVIRRNDADCAAGDICLGIALPPDRDGVKLRVPLCVGLAGVREMRPPLAIPEVVMHAALPWRTALCDLHDAAAAQGLSLRVYGSLALQAITGQPYLRLASDIDVLFCPDNADQLSRGMRLLTSYAAKLPLDGEVEFPDGAAVSWKEWVQASDSVAGVDNNRVLAKRSSDVALLRVGDLLAALEANACPT